MGKNAIESFGFQSLDTASLATATALTVPDGAKYCLVQCEGGAVRWRDDETDPTDTVGMKLADGGELMFDGTMPAVKFIAASGTPTLMISFYG